MTEKVQDAADTGAEEQQELPTPEISTGSTQASSTELDIVSLAETVAQQVLEQLNPVLDDKVDARFKSGKDIRYNKVEEIYQWVKEAGGDTSKITNQLESTDLRNRLEALETRDVGSSPASAQGLEGETVTLRNNLKDRFGVELSRDELAELAASKTYVNTVDWLTDVTDKTMAKVQQSNAVPSAPAPSGGSAASAVSDDDYDALAAELAKLRGGPADPLTMAKRLEIQNKMRSLAGMSEYNRGASANI